MASRKLRVLTSFGDVASLAEGFVERVDEGTLMLYAADSYEEGDSVEFEVLLEDNSAALTGRGVSAGSFDGGPERPNEARFDVVLNALEFDGAGAVVYDRILQIRSGLTTGETNVSDLEAGQGFDEEYEAQPTRIAPADVDVDVDLFANDPHTVVRSFDSAEAGAPAAHEENTVDVPWDAPASVSSVRPAAPASVPPASEPPRAAFGGLEPVMSDAPPSVPPAHLEAGSIPDWDDSVGDVEPTQLHSFGGEGHTDDGHTDEVVAPREEEGAFAEEVPSAAQSWRPAAPSSAPPPAAAPSDRGGPGAAWEGEVARMSVTGADLVLAPVPGAPEAPPPFPVVRLAATGAVLLRPAHESSWDAASLLERRAPRPASGHFQYAAGELPVPAAPPRPDADTGGFLAQPSGSAHAGFGDEDETDLLEEEA